MDTLPPEIVDHIAQYLYADGWNFYHEAVFNPWDRTSLNVWKSPRYFSYRLYFSPHFVPSMLQMDWEVDPVFAILYYISKCWTWIDIKTEELQQLHRVAYEKNLVEMAHMMWNGCRMSQYYTTILEFEGENALLRAVKERCDGIFPVNLDDLETALQCNDLEIFYFLVQLAMNDSKPLLESADSNRDLENLISYWKHIKDCCETCSSDDSLQLWSTYQPLYKKAKLMLKNM